MTLKTLQLSNSPLKVSYQDIGHGEPLILIHGVGMQSCAWEPQIKELSKSYRVIAVDMPGHGKSDPLPEGAGIEDYVFWFHSFTLGLNVDRINLAGHSMGAMIAGGYAVTYPNFVRRVALLNGVYRRTTEARAAVKARAAEIKQGNIDLETPLKRWFSCDDEIVREKVAVWLSDVDLFGYATAYGAFASGDMAYVDQLSDIACPMLALTGDDDPNSTPQMAIDMASAVQNGNYRVLPGQRHMVNLTAPDEVNHILLEWLKQPEVRKDV
ncbi:alpha/beta hydrolase [Amylibacter sp. SFDW26]|uniref:alpha/beta fold hydrolase n=1 Tax=Amylibacter sp. SFDW26 TaxID=2652722 RepID=UPI001261D127|nr:alpha/beta hydrolase [Amylibacter sp. SFDW26]KAB7614395.1 alpha/beta hydrolase [Amylibacter sp. SFDW26]